MRLYTVFTIIKNLKSVIITIYFGCIRSFPEKGFVLLQPLHLPSSVRIYQPEESRFTLIQSFPPEMVPPSLPRIPEAQSLLL